MLKVSESENHKNIPEGLQVKMILQKGPFQNINSMTGLSVRMHKFNDMTGEYRINYNLFMYC